MIKNKKKALMHRKKRKKEKGAVTQRLISREEKEGSLLRSMFARPVFGHGS